jgi:hypothetical protein
MQALGDEVGAEFFGGGDGVAPILASGKAEARGNAFSVDGFNYHDTASNALARSDTWTLQKCP